MLDSTCWTTTMYATLSPSSTVHLLKTFNFLSCSGSFPQNFETPTYDACSSGLLPYTANPGSSTPTTTKSIPALARRSRSVQAGKARARRRPRQPMRMRE